MSMDAPQGSQPGYSARMMFSGNAELSLTKKGTEKIVAAILAREREWLSDQMVKLLPPEMFLRAFGNDECKRSVHDVLLGMGVMLCCYPDGRQELRRGNEVLSTLMPVVFDFGSKEAL